MLVYEMEGNMRRVYKSFSFLNSPLNLPEIIFTGNMQSFRIIILYLFYSDSVIIKYKLKERHHPYQICFHYHNQNI